MIGAGIPPAPPPPAAAAPAAPPVRRSRCRFQPSRRRRHPHRLPRGRRTRRRHPSPEQVTLRAAGDANTRGQQEERESSGVGHVFTMNPDRSLSALSSENGSPTAAETERDRQPRAARRERRFGADAAARGHRRPPGLRRRSPRRTRTCPTWALNVAAGPAQGRTTVEAIDVRNVGVPRQAHDAAARAEIQGERKPIAGERYAHARARAQRREERRRLPDARRPCVTRDLDADAG